MSSRTLAQNIAKLSADVTNAYTALAAKGATIPASKTTDSLSATIDTVQQGDEPVYGVSSQKQILGNPDGTWTGIEQFGFRGTRTQVPAWGSEYCFAGNPCISSFNSVAKDSPEGRYNYMLANSFRNCVNLVSAEIPISSTSTYFMQNAFAGCTSLKTLEFPNLTALENYVLQNCFTDNQVIERVSFPKVTYAGMYALRNIAKGATHLTAFEVPELTALGSSGLLSAFSYCSALTDVSFPKLKSVGNWACNQSFAYSGVSSLSFPEVTSINQYGQQTMFVPAGNIAARQPTTRHVTDYSNMYPKLKSVANYGMQYAFATDYKSTTPIAMPSFPQLTSVADYGMAGLLSTSSQIQPTTGIPSFPNLLSAGPSSFRSAFHYTDLLTRPIKIEFPELTSVGNSTFRTAFSAGATIVDEVNLSVSFPKITSLSGNMSTFTEFMYSYYGSSATTVHNSAMEFANLSSIIGGVFFGGSIGIKKYYFPKLSYIPDSTVFHEPTNPKTVEVHFAAENQEALQSSVGWPYKWGLNNKGTIYFDL